MSVLDNPAGLVIGFHDTEGHIEMKAAHIMLEFISTIGRKPHIRIQV